MPSVTYECEDCGHQEEHTLRMSYNEDGMEDGFEEEEEEVLKCAECGSTDITQYTHGVAIRDESREDFHSDG